MNKLISLLSKTFPVGSEMEPTHVHWRFCSWEHKVVGRIKNELHNVKRYAPIFCERNVNTQNIF